MEIKEINNPIVWNKFFDEQDSPSFLQSWEWGELQKKLGYGTIRLGIYNKQRLIAVLLVIKIDSKRGKFLFIPHGPVGKITPSLISRLFNRLVSLAKNENYSFVRISPLLEDNAVNRRLFRKLGFKTAPIYMNAENSWILPLDKSEDELLTSMRKTTRYLIRRAERDGVAVAKSTDEKYLADFLTVYKVTVDRENFTAFSDKYIRGEFKTFNDVGNALILTAKYQQQVLASAIVLFTKSTAFYHQGASIHSKVPAPYLLQWEAIREAKRRGCRFYNFWGIKIPGRTPKNWDGLTLFKTGFGGYEAKYIPTQDYILSPKYYLTYLYEKFLAWRRGV